MAPFSLSQLGDDLLRRVVPPPQFGSPFLIRLSQSKTDSILGSISWGHVNPRAPGKRRDLGTARRPTTIGT